MVEEDFYQNHLATLLDAHFLYSQSLNSEHLYKKLLLSYLKPTTRIDGHGVETI